MVMAMERPAKRDPRLYSVYLAVRLCSAEQAMRLLEGWAEYRINHRKVRRPFSEGGAIQRQQIATEGNFVAGAIDYGDLVSAIEALPPRQWDAVEMYWGVGLRSVGSVARALRRRDFEVRADLWDGVTAVMDMLTGEDQAYFVRRYRADLSRMGRDRY